MEFELRRTFGMKRTFITQPRLQNYKAPEIVLATDQIFKISKFCRPKLGSEIARNLTQKAPKVISAVAVNPQPPPETNKPIVESVHSWPSQLKRFCVRRGKFILPLLIATAALSESDIPWNEHLREASKKLRNVTFTPTEESEGSLLDYKVEHKLLLMEERMKKTEEYIKQLEEIIKMNQERKNSEREAFSNRLPEMEESESLLADKTGMADYALESAGGEIIESLTSSGISSGNAMVKLWNIPLFYHTMSPRLAIQPNVHPGNCFAFVGKTGQLALRLARPIHVQNLTVEHIPKAIAFGDNLDSAPREMVVEGMADDGTFHTLGSIEYDVDWRPVQTFRLSASSRQLFKSVRLRVLSNWGNPNYTCIYRIRVHGQQ